MKKDEKLEVEDGREFTSRTIVGGRPRLRRRHTMHIPAGIEKVLVKAAMDPEFRRALLEDRIEAVESSGIRLTPLEAVVLAKVPYARLELMIGGIRPRRHAKRRFMRAVATAVVTLATGTAGVACEEKSGAEPQDGGDASDLVLDLPLPDAERDTGDVPLDDYFDVAPTGIWPDDPYEDHEDAEEDAEEE